LSRGFSKISAKIFEGFATYLQPIAVGCDFGYPCGVATLGNRPCPLTLILYHNYGKKSRWHFAQTFAKKITEIVQNAEKPAPTLVGARRPQLKKERAISRPLG
jgi:hypothetical protein